MTVAAISLGIASKTADEIKAAAKAACTEYQISKFFSDGVTELEAGMNAVIEKSSFVCSMAANVGPAVGKTVENSIAVPAIDVIQIKEPELANVLRRAQHSKLGRLSVSAMKSESLTPLITQMITDAGTNAVRITAIRALKDKLFAFIDAITADEV